MLSAILTAASWRGWPTGPGPSITTDISSLDVSVAAVRSLYVQYALMAASLVPAMIFLVDFIARGLHGGAALGSRFWVLYGVGAMIGPPLYGLLADRIGAHSALRALLLVQALALVLLAMTSSYSVIAVLAVVIGSFPPGIIPPILARVKQLAPTNAAQRNRIWSGATTLFAASQALSAYTSSAIFNKFDGDYRLLFWMRAVATGLAFGVEYFSDRQPPTRRKQKRG